MKTTPNPFVRGYQNLRIERTLCISYADDCPPAFRQLHPSQETLSDEDIEQHGCLFCDEFALVTENHAVDEALKEQCSSDRTVVNVVYGIIGDQAGESILVGDSYSLQHAQEVLQSLSFETGFYSRCWEISTVHLDEIGRCYLSHLVDSVTPPDTMFVTFRIPYEPSIGIKLIATPWTDENLLHVEELTGEQLRQEHHDKGIPSSLLEVLHLAGQADVRMLVFDADAPTLEGLPSFDE
ncbi:ABC transporter substrate-binding protein [Pseudomonas chlororaphis subsp. piscium]|nr:ABC transporter substrate-binding protein [Pseudomonas chlororaphis subsp. piscium]